MSDRDPRDELLKAAFLARHGPTPCPVADARRAWVDEALSFGLASSEDHRSRARRGGKKARGLRVRRWLPGKFDRREKPEKT